MKILFTGGSSFTGYWFIKELVGAGHEVVVTLREEPENYTGVRAERVARLKGLCRFLTGVTFGDENFIKVIHEQGDFDVLCHHAADVENYKDLSFNIARALENNTKNITGVLSALKQTGANRIILTGSVFESDEGAGSEGGQAFSPYGVSKSLTSNVFRFWTQHFQMSLGKFVIPNPFGPFEEPRFTSYLVKNWFSGQTPVIQTPDYVRDNIHISLLAKLYVRFVEKLNPETSFSKLNPSGYVGTQKFFAELLSQEMAKRLSLSCAVEALTQTDFAEPRIRINTDCPDYSTLEWSETLAWDELADYYRSVYKKN